MQDRKLLTRRNLIIGSGALAAYGLLEAAGLGPLAHFFQPTSLPERWKSYEGSLSEEERHLFKKYCDASPQTQVQTLRTIEARIDAETSLGNLYGNIKTKANIPIVSSEDLEKKAREDARAKMHYANFLRAKHHEYAYAAYFGELDTVILSTRDYPEDVLMLLQHRQTRDAILAHEMIHGTHHRSSDFYAFLTFVHNNRRGPELMVILDTRNLQGYGSNVMGVDGVSFSAAAEDFKERHRRYEAGKNERSIISEVGADFIAARVEKDEVKISDPKFTQVPRDQVPILLGSLLQLYGYFAANGPPDDVDIRVAEFVGKYGESVKSLGAKVREWREPIKYEWKGLDVLNKRSKELDRARQITCEALSTL